MEELISWFSDNKEWLFSGVGVVLIAWMCRVLFKKRQVVPTQSIQSGDGSTNIQSGRDVNIGTQVKKDDVDKEQ